MLNIKFSNYEILPKFSHVDLDLTSILLDPNDPLRNIEKLLERYINKKEIISEEFEVEHYFIDWRPMNLHSKIRTY